MLLPNLAVLVVKPTGETASRETGRIHSKVGFNRLQGQAGFSDETLEDARQVGILKIIGNAVEMRNLGDVSAPVGFSQVGHEPPLRNGGINLERDVKNGIGERQPRTTILGRSGYQTGAQVAQKGLEFILLSRLGRVIGRPRLPVSRLPRLRECNALGHSGSAISILFPLHHKRSGIDVFASRFTLLEVGALASRKLLSNLNAVESRSALRRNHPPSAIARIFAVAAITIPRSLSGP